MVFVIWLPRSLSFSNFLSVLSTLLMMVMVMANLIRVDSFPIRKRHTPFCVSATLCGPLHASFRNDGSDSNTNDSNGNSNAITNNDIEILKQIRERQLREAVLENLFLSKDLPTLDSDSSSSSSFVSLSLVGQSKLSLAAREIGYDEEKEEGKETKNNSFATVLVVSPTKGDMPFESSNSNSNSNSKDENDPLPLMFLPLAPPTDSRLRLLSKVYAAKPISSFSNMIQWNLNLINRDDSLFDNIPWNQWSKDPDRKNRDFAGNLVLEKFRYGKRDAYNRFTGKDVNAKTVATSRRKYWEKKLISSLASDDDPNDSSDEDNDNDNDNDVSFSQSFLSKRVLELRVQELRMEIAEVDSQLAISRTSNNSKTQEDLEVSRMELVQTLQEAERTLNALLSSLSSSLSSPKSTVENDGINIIDKIARWAVEMSINVRTEQNEAPYRGATGYGPRLSYDDDDANVEFYRSPFDLLNEILSDQLNAEVIECVLENTSWLGGTIALEGAVVLRRRTPTIETTLMGETLQTPDRGEDFGNFVKGGDIFVVECDVDEAIGVALSCDLPIRVERSIFERSSMMGVRVGTRKNNENNNPENGKIKSAYKNIKEKLPHWETMDSGISIDVEGDSLNPNASRVSPISIPRTTSSLFDTIFEPSSNNNDDDTSTSSMFPTDNPITSINQLDSLGNKGKAKTLLEMSNFSRRLPRPRTVRKAPVNENPLDKLLLPLIDESVRNEYNVRDAERRGDLNLANELKAKRSNRQKAKEKVDAARRDGNEDLAEKWESEAKFQEALRADVTQDEGSYSRFLDKDDWYERDRQKTANRAKRSSFGNLLDGIE
jgi:hypothetical protein